MYEDFHFPLSGVFDLCEEEATPPQNELTPQIDEKDECCLIYLTRGYYTLVDSDVYAWASRFMWQALITRGKVYAVRTKRKCEKLEPNNIYLHRQIMGIVNTPTWIADHIHGFSLDNRKVSLRLATKFENNINVPSRKHYNHFRGVYIYPEGSPKYGRCRSRVIFGKTEYHCGTFPNTKEGVIRAAKARDIKLIELMPETPTEILNRLLNFPVEPIKSKILAYLDDIPF